jgi:hypothetical protein
MIARILFFAAMLGVSAIAIGQGPPAPPPGQGSPDRKPRDLFFRTMYEVRSRAGHDLAYLLFQKKVRDEIGLSDERHRAVMEIGKALRSDTEDLHNQFKSEKIAPEQLAPKLREVVSASDKKFLEALGSDTVRNRLIGLFVQHRKASAALNELVAAKIGLSDEKRKELLGIKENRERELIEAAFAAAPKLEDRRKNWEKIQRQIDDLVSENLTSEQREKLEALKGKPFEFEPNSMGPGRPRREHDEHRDRSDRNCCQVASIE